MPHMPRRFRSVQGDAAVPRQLAPSDTVPPDLIDIYSDLPVSGEPPSDKPTVARNPVVRSRQSKTPGLDTLSMKKFSVPPSAIEDDLFG